MNSKDNSLAVKIIEEVGSLLNIDSMVEASLSASSKEIAELIAKVLEIFGKERSKGRIGNSKINGDLVLLPYEGRLVVVGDIHGDLKSLTRILKLLSKKFEEDTKIVFLGDYGDRGAYSVEVYYLLLSLKISIPENVIMMKGNHECPELPFYPYDLPYQLRERFGSKGNDIHDMLKLMFKQLYIATLIENSYLLVHGGAPVRVKSLDEIANARKTYPSSSVYEELLWNDPREVEGFIPSARGYGFYFGKDITKKLLSVSNAKIMIRAHEPCDGTMVSHDGLILTLFSCKGIYANIKAAYLDIELKGELLDAYKISSIANYF